MTFTVHGVGVSRGIAIGQAYIVERTELELNDTQIDAADVKNEIYRLRDATAKAKSDLKEVRRQIPKNTRVDIAAFIDTHLLMLEDSALTSDAERLVKEQKCNAAWALKLQCDALSSAFDAMDDAYLRTRKDDVEHVVNRIQRILLDEAPIEDELSMRSMQGMVVVADDLTPADTVLMQSNGVLGFVTESGGPTSHMSILARSLGIPGIVGAHGVRRFLRQNETVIVDGGEGVVVGDPDAGALTYYRANKLERDRYLESLEALRDAPAITRDGQRVALHANVELQNDFDAAHDVNANGVGLYRTEFLYMNRTDRPDEEEHFETYRNLIRALDGMPVTIRTLDLGADKDFEPEVFTGSANPALGLRAIRLSLHQPDLYWPQLRAIIRASAFGPVRLMIPMLSSVDEVTQVVDNIRSVQRDFVDQGVEFDPAMPIGGMIEVPSAAICADVFAKYLDFFSIGTNDLIQYTMAIDRDNDAVSYLYDPLNPAVLRLIAMTIDAGKDAGIPVAMCGEMAGDRRFTRLLLGLGLREFSVHPSLLLELKQIINETSIEAIRESVRSALSISSSEELYALVTSLQ